MKKCQKQAGIIQPAIGASFAVQATIEPWHGERKSKSHFSFKFSFECTKVTSNHLIRPLLLHWGQKVTSSDQSVLSLLWEIPMNFITMIFFYHWILGNKCQFLEFSKSNFGQKRLEKVQLDDSRYVLTPNWCNNT